MRVIARRLVLTHALVAVLLCAPPRALAESAAPACHVAEVAPRSAEIPPSTRRFAVTIDGFSFDIAQIRLAHVEHDGSRTAVPAHLDEATRGRRTVELVLAAPLVSGERYVLEHRVCPLAGFGPVETEYIAGPEVSDPLAAGALEVSPVYAANDVPGASQRYYFARVSFAPDASLAPWSPSASTVLWVDGPERTYRARDAEPRHWDLRVACGLGTGELGEGLHAFGGHVEVLGLDRLAIPSVEATIACDGATRVDPSTLRELTPEEQILWDTEQDGGAAEIDAGVAGSFDAGGDPDAPHEPRRGGGCSVGQAGSPGGPAWLFFGLGLVALRARRVLG